MSDVDPRLVRALRAQLDSRAAGARIGWKVGAGVGERIGDEPVAVGHLTAATVLENGSTYEGGGDALHADAELAVEVSADAVSIYAVALELVDLSRGGDPEAVVASNIFHRAVAFGPRVATSTATSPRPLRGRVLVNGEERGRANAPRDLLDRVDAVTRVLTAVGERLEPGDRVITGSIVQVPIRSGDDVVAHIEGLGAVGLLVA